MEGGSRPRGGLEVGNEEADKMATVVMKKEVVSEMEAIVIKRDNSY